MCIALAAGTVGLIIAGALEWTIVRRLWISTMKSIWRRGIFPADLRCARQTFYCPYYCLFDSGFFGQYSGKKDFHRYLPTGYTVSVLFCILEVLWVLMLDLI